MKLKNFPVEYTEDEIIHLLVELNNELDQGTVTEGRRINLERKVLLCQNQLQLNSLIKSNEQLQKQQETLIKQQETLGKLFEDNTRTSNRTAKEAKAIIFLTILTIIVTSILDWYHMSEVYKNQETTIKLIERIINIK